MNAKRIIRPLVILFILTTNVGCDQISKKIVRHNVAYHETISVLGNRITLTKIENAGAFLSVGNKLPQPLKIVLLTFLPFLVLTVGLCYVLTNHNLSWITILGSCLVIGGGLGNLYDRVIFGSVTDFLHIDFGLFQTGIFNMADVSIMAGLAILTVSYARKRNSWQNAG